MVLWKNDIYSSFGLNGFGLNCTVFIIIDPLRYWNWFSPVTHSRVQMKCELSLFRATHKRFYFLGNITQPKIQESLICNETTCRKCVTPMLCVVVQCVALLPLQWRHNERNGVSNHQPHHCLLNRLFRRRSKKNIKAPRHWPLCGKFTGDRWIPRTNGQWRGKCFRLMTSSFDIKQTHIMMTSWARKVSED